MVLPFYIKTLAIESDKELIKFFVLLIFRIYTDEIFTPRMCRCFIGEHSVMS